MVTTRECQRVTNHIEKVVVGREGEEKLFSLVRFKNPVEVGGEEVHYIGS